MNNTSYIEIRLNGIKDGVELTPVNYDIKELRKFLEIAEKLFENDRDTVALKIEEGSVRNMLFVSLAMATLINANISFLNSGEIDKVQPRYINAFNAIGHFCKQTNFAATLSTSESQNNVLNINKDTNFIQTRNSLVNTEFNFVGEITDAGGTDKINIHLKTIEHGSLTIKADKEFLSNIKNNLLYKNYSIMVEGLADYVTGEFDKNSFKLLSMAEFNPFYDKDEIDKHIQITSEHWKEIDDVDSWLDEVRGYHEHD